MDTVSVDRDGNVLLIGLNRPQKHNAFTQEMLADLSRAYALLESDVQVFAIGIFDPDGAKRTPEEANGPRLLDELAEQTGGRLYSVDKLDELSSISTRIGNELRNQYLVGYSPSNAIKDGKYRHVKVKLVAPDGMANLRTYYRHGYYAPAQ